ncbi:MAG: hypothetical protein JHC74_10185 [Thermoleophilia bacterium]|nr:hypothetical protein [Thermoleophilia bacterium]
MTGERWARRVGALIVAVGVFVTASSFTPIVTSGFWFVGGLGAIALGAVVLRFGGPADWWPGMRTKNF